MMRTKKGVELGVNTMIIIVLALLVLIIIGYLVIKSVGNSTTATTCNSRGGQCRSACITGELPSSYSCKDQGGGVCCVPIPT